MTSSAFDYTDLFVPDLPAPARPWAGFPEFNFVGGNNDPDSVPVDGLSKAATAVLRREGSTLATYGLASGPQGYKPLREFVAAKVGRHAGLQCSADNVLITSGSLQGIDLVNELFLAPGDTVIAEQFSYGGALSRLARLGVEVVGVPVDDDGLRTDALADSLAGLAARGIKPKYIYTIPTVQNPTSTIMSEQRRTQLLRVAADHGVMVFEDECYSDLIWSGQRPPSLAALDKDGRVVHIGSFSKSIAPALRVGYVVADWAVISQILACKTDAGSGALEQMVLAEYCSEQFDDHVKALNRRLQQKAQILVDALDQHFGTAAEFTPPPGGIFLWVKLPESIDTLALAGAASAAGIAYNPGPEWSTDAAPAKSSLRLCFANPTPQALREGVAKLAEVFARETGIPERSANVARS